MSDAAPPPSEREVEKQTLDAWSRFKHSAKLEPVETLIEWRAAAQSAYAPAHVLRKIDAMVGASKRLARRDSSVPIEYLRILDRVALIASTDCDDAKITDHTTGVAQLAAMCSPEIILRMISEIYDSRQARVMRWGGEAVPPSLDPSPPVDAS